MQHDASLTNLIDALRHCEDVDKLSPVALQDIRGLERELGCLLPDSLVRVYTELGGLMGHGGQLFGPRYALKETIDLRRDYPQAPRDGVVIGSIGNGEMYVIECGTESRPPDGAVRIWMMAGTFDDADRVDSLASFLKREFKLER